ncbi:MAG: hypothetical protein BMS9Abin14_249 [Gammaproteobacteria bacterium]|nr:MAG: hypothetical protein BMS9Abin14_249 [Gammaproteobacteria bacterium]
MNPDERDQELLREYLKGGSALSRLYRRDADEQPDTHIDARILAEARRAVAPKRRVVRSPFARHWMVPTSLAAVLVLSVSVVLLMPDPALEPAVERERAAQPTLVPGAVSAPQPAESVRLRDAAPEADQAAVGERASGSLQRQAPAPKRKSLTGGEAKSRPAVPAGGVAEEVTSEAAPRSLSQSVPGPAPIPADAVQADPAAWLHFIESLLAEHNREAAKDSLRAFLTRYPDFPLPTALRPLAASLDAERD